MSSTSTSSEPAATGARAPGEPLAPGELDPELVNLRTTRRPVGAIAALAVALLSVYLIVRLLPDLRFARRADAPRVLDATAGEIATSDDDFVEVRHRVGYGRAQRVRSTTGGLGMRLTPVIGTSGRVWIAQPGSGFGDPVDGKYVGRARALDDVAFGAALRARTASAPVPLYVASATWRATAAGAPLATVDFDAFTPAPGDVVELDTVVPERVRVLATFTERQPDLAAWTAALAGAGLTVDATQAPTSTGRSAEFVVRAPSLAAVSTALDKAQLWGALPEAITETRRSTVGELRANTDALGPGAIGGDVLLRIWGRAPVPRDAVVVIMGERPGDYWYVLPVVIVLGLIGALFLWAFVRALRRDWLPARAS